MNEVLQSELKQSLVVSQHELEQIQSNLKSQIGDASFNAWFSPVYFELHSQSDTARVVVDTKFKAHYISQHYLCDIQSTISSVFGRQLDIVVLADDVQQSLLRSVPAEDRQFDLFVPAITEIPIKDDVHLMEIAPFTLQPRSETRTRLLYTNIDGMEVEIKAHPDSGLPTPTDYDIVLLMQSKLASEANRYRREMEYYHEKKSAGMEPPTPVPPSRSFRPTISEIMQFTRNYDKELGKRHGKKQAAVLEDRLDRLKRTDIKLRRTSGRKRRVGTFSYIQDWRVISESETGNILEVEIDIPNWVYEGIVETNRPTIRTYDRDYHLLKQPVMQFLYRFLRLHVSDVTKEFSLEELHRRSGSRQVLKEFNRTLTKRVQETQEEGFFEWNLSLEGRARQRALKVEPKNLPQ